jgi:hypothetical protein
MGLSDSRFGHRPVMDFRTALSWDSPKRVSQVSDGSVGARRPQLPRRAVTLHLLVASRHVWASPSPVGWPPGMSVTRPDRVHAEALRLTPLPQGAPTAGLLQTSPRWLHGERALTMASTFQLTRSARLSLAHRRHRGHGGEKILTGVPSLAPDMHPVHAGAETHLDARSVDSMRGVDWTLARMILSKRREKTAKATLCSPCLREKPVFPAPDGTHRDTGDTEARRS